MGVGCLVFVLFMDRSKAVVPVLVLLFVALWFILRGDLLYVFPCVILFLCFSVLLVLRLPRLGKRELILVLFVRLSGLCLFGFVVSSSPWGLGRAAVFDCGTPWTFPLPFLFIVCYHLFVLLFCRLCSVIVAISGRLLYYFTLSLNSDAAPNYKYTFGPKNSYPPYLWDITVTHTKSKIP